MIAQAFDASSSTLRFTGIVWCMETGLNENVHTPVKHGTLYAYAGRGCRCGQCKEAARVYSTAYRSTDNGRDASRRSAARNNFIRQNALKWIRENRPDVIDELEAAWEEKLAKKRNHG